jgi:hypothetical protein
MLDAMGQARSSGCKGWSVFHVVMATAELLTFMLAASILGKMEEFGKEAQVPHSLALDPGRTPSQTF